VAVALFGAEGCGEQELPTALNEAQATDVEGLADWTYQQIWGDAQQKDAGQFLAYHAINDPIQQCMAAQSFAYPAEFHPLWSGYRSNGTSGAWMGHLQEPPSRTEVSLARSRQYELDPERNPDVDKPGYHEALAECEKSAGDPDAVVIPPGTEELGSKWTELMASVEEELGSIEPYTECMATAGYDLAAVDADGQAALYMLLMSRLPNPPLPGEQPSSAWTEYLSYEAEALAADEKCRADRYRQGLAVLEPRLREFRQQHAQDLTASEQAWGNLLSRAERAGYEH
jgi:hypothetical protein